MGSFPPPNSRAGYATPAALVLSLAMALIASALVGRSVMQLRLARADFTRTQAEYLLDGAHLAAAAAIVRSNTPGPYAWAFTSDVGWVDAVAELEDEKLSLDAASNLTDGALKQFGVKDVAALKARLAAAASATGAVDVVALDEAPLWKRCAGSMMSRFGRQTVFTYLARTEPGPGPKPALWRIGEEWRISLTTTTGWRDDRIVRFTGDARHPTATVIRRVSRGKGDGGQCETLFAGMAGA